ncbi:MAG: hypothetical protein PF542_01900 [Nanoarchaeota archaeon]|jgi:hypothetical protein|nr:hypothetical protein [Nanoarchaeota archaeon]
MNKTNFNFWILLIVFLGLFQTVYAGDESSISVENTEMDCILENHAMCNGQCIDLSNNDLNCGMCGTECESNSQNCVNSICIENSEAELSPYNEFLKLLKDNYIINIQGIRNDSSIQYMSINLIDGNVIDEENDDAYLLFEVEQETIEDMFTKGGNLGIIFFNKVVSGEIKMTKLDNIGMFESIGNWVGGIFSDNDLEKVDSYSKFMDLELIKLNMVCDIDGSYFDFDEITCLNLKGNYEKENNQLIVNSLENWELENEEILFNKRFLISNESDALKMLGEVMNAREEGKVAQNVWDNFGVGDKFKDRVNLDGSIDLGAFTDGIGDEIGNLDGIGGFDDGLGGRIGGFDNIGGSTDFDDGLGDMGNPNGGFMGDGLGNDYRGNGNTGGFDDGLGGFGDSNKDGGYDGQMGGDSGYGDTSGLGGAAGAGAGGLGGGAGQDTTWGVEANHFSYKHSGSSGYDSFSHHQESVSNDNGFSSTTDKQSFTSADGTTTTRVVVTQTDADGNTKTSSTTTTKDSDGNSKSTQTYTETDSDGEVTEQETTTKSDPPEDGDDDSCEPADGEYHDNYVPPGEAEKQSAVGRAIMNGGLAGGSPIGYEQAGAVDGVGTFDPNGLGCQDGGCTNREVGVKVNEDKFDTGNINPGLK